MNNLEQIVNENLRNKFLETEVDVENLEHHFTTDTNPLTVKNQVGVSQLIDEIFNWLCDKYQINTYGLCAIRCTYNKLVSINFWEEDNCLSIHSHIYDVK